MKRGWRRERRARRQAYPAGTGGELLALDAIGVIAIDDIMMLLGNEMGYVAGALLGRVAEGLIDDQEDQRKVRGALENHGAQVRDVRYQSRGGETTGPDRVLQASEKPIWPSSHQLGASPRLTFLTFLTLGCLN
jgi:hypothetical protein